MNRKFVLPLMLVLLASASCGRQYAKGEYIDTETVILRSDRFVESDLKIIAEKLVGSLIASPGFSGNESVPPVIMSKLTNSTDEHIDMQSLSEKIQVILFKSGKVKFINAKMRGEIQSEHEYEEAGFVDPATAVKRGKQIGAKYLISGNIASIKQPVGRQEIVYYKATLELTDIKTNLITWMDDIEIRKQFKKRYTGT